jgi:predicted lipoprotein with Yx(FWY)xxD motif
MARFRGWSSGSVSARSAWRLVVLGCVAWLAVAACGGPASDQDAATAAARVKGGFEAQAGAVQGISTRQATAATPQAAGAPKTGAPTGAGSVGSPAPGGGGAAANAAVRVTSNAKLGNILTDADGRTLYTLSSDTPNTSTCTGGCLTPWPPFVSAAAPGAPAGVTGAFALIPRADTGARQVTLNGMPLYYFARDAAAGDANGDGVNAFGGTWHVVKAG